MRKVMRWQGPFIGASNEITCGQNPVPFQRTGIQNNCTPTQGKKMLVQQEQKMLTQQEQVPKMLTEHTYPAPACVTLSRCRSSRVSRKLYLDWRKRSESKHVTSTLRILHTKKSADLAITASLPWQGHTHIHTHLSPNRWASSYWSKLCLLAVELTNTSRSSSSYVGGGWGRKNILG